LVIFFVLVVLVAAGDASGAEVEELHFGEVGGSGEHDV
jgi:hypothetical protein